MADNSPSPPPKPKPGSLRDRIAAFENKAAAAPTPGPPPPRPKPAGFASWKPKPPSPPSSPQPAPNAGASESAPESPARGTSGRMNAADAKESITRAGGSLKERMAALQGRGAFGAPAPPPTAPKPAVQNKPKWKPPPQVAQVPVLGGDDDDDVQDVKDADAGEGHPSTSPKPPSVKSPPAIIRSPDSGAAAEGEEDEDAEVKGPSADVVDQESGEKLVDEEEEERQRRAAIAARMAKLGGARFGMAPPVFGKPAVPLPSKKPSLPTPAPVQAESEVEQKELVIEPTVSPSASPRPPASMPAPAMPKRTAGPRRKPAKSTSTAPEDSPIPPPAEPSISAEVVGSDAPKVDDVIAEAGKEAQVSLHEQEAAVPVAAVEEREVHEKEEEEHPEENQPVAEEDEDEETRKKRVAERLARMGGVNPMALPPRRTSVDDVAPRNLASPPSSPPLSKPLRRSSTGHSGSLPPAPAAKPASLKRTSVGSISSITSPPVFPSEGSGRRGSVGSVEGRVSGSGRRASIGSARSVKREDVHGVSEIVEEPEEMMDQDRAVKPHAEAKEDIRGSGVVENDERDRDRGMVQQQDNYRDDREVEDYSDDFDATPRPPARLPATSTYPSYTSSRSVPDPGLNASVIPPPPGPPPPLPTVTTEPPQQQKQHTSSVRRTDKPLPPVLAPSAASRESSVERLSQPAIPRRLVPQTPEPEGYKEFEDTDGEGHSADPDVRDSQVDDEDDDNDDDGKGTKLLPPPTLSALSGKGTRMLAAGVDDGEESEPALPVPLRVGRGAGGEGVSRGRGYAETDEESNVSSEAPLPVRVNLGGGEHHQMAPSSSAPPLDALPSGTGGNLREESGSEYSAEAEDEEEGYDEEEEEEEEEEKLLRTRPLSSRPREEESMAVPTHEGSYVKHSPIRSIPPPPVQEVEVLDEDEGDPIDPSFHSPSRNDLDSPPHSGSPSGGDTSVATTTATTTTPVPRRSLPVPVPVPVPSPTSAPVPVSEKAQDEGADDEDWEKKRRQNIAERMARLGAIQFGAPGQGRSPVGGSARKVVSERQPGDEDQYENPEEEEVAKEPVQGVQGGEEEDEEEERARRERIAAKLAGMGGMRIGMMPMTMPPKQSRALREEPQQQQVTSGGMSESRISEEGVKVDVEDDSEIEEVGYEEAKGSEEGSGVEVSSPPPLPPPRTPRRQGTGASISSISSPPRSAGRPPVPMTGPFKRASVQSVQKVTLPPPVHAQPSEYVMVDEPESYSGEISNREEEAPPPPPPPRPTRRTSTHPPPARAAPSAPAQMTTEERAESHDQWELPAIPTSSLGADLSASWSESVFDDHEHQGTRPETLQSHSHSAPLPVPPPSVVTPVPAAAVPTSPEALHFDSDELMAIWGRVGVQICEVATTMYDHSKKTLVGDGTYRGFINAVLSEVPNASRPHSKQMPFGYLVYLQNGGQVQKRASEILPGDIVEIMDAKFKGHKGLGTYTQHVGGGAEGGEGGGPVSGVVSEFEQKKSKVRVFQANQHVGQQTVEAVTYRLEDLKSGLVKVYRVLEAQ